MDNKNTSNFVIKIASKLLYEKKIRQYKHEYTFLLSNLFFLDCVS